MASDIANILSVQPPATPPQGQSGSQPSAQTGSQTSGNNPPATPPAAGSPQNPQAPTDNPTQTGDTSPQGENPANNSSGNGSHFGNLLAAKQQTGSSSTPPAKPATLKSSADQSDAGNANAAAVFMLAQLQLQPAQSDAGGVQDTGADAAGSAGTGQASDANVLQQLLQQAITADNNPAGAGNPTGQPASSGTDANTNQTQTLSQFASLLQDTGSSPSAGTDDAAQAILSTSAGQNTNPDTALIAQLGKALEGKPGGTAGTGNTKPADGTNTASAALSQPPVAQNTVLQSALAQITGLLSPSHGNKSDSGGSDILSAPANSGTTNANTLPAGATPPVTAGNNQSQGANNTFVKFLSAASSNASPADQVLVQIRNQASQGTSQIRIQLEPAELGKVTVQMNTGTDGKTGVTITADNRQTLSMLQSEARSLESALRNVGLKTNTGGLSFNLSGQQPGGQNTGKQGSYTQVAATTTTEDDTDYYSTVSGIYRFAAQQGLDIRV